MKVWRTSGELGLKHIALLEKTPEGILISPCPVVRWDEIFTDKLPIGSQPSALDLSEVSGDDLLF
jgi:hypothetical protein